MIRLEIIEKFGLLIDRIVYENLLDIERLYARSYTIIKSYIVENEIKNIGFDGKIKE